MCKLSLLIAALLITPLVSGEKPVVLITGASRGIGLATASLLAQNGFEVYGTVRNPDLSVLPRQEGLHFEVLNVKDCAGIDALVAKIIDQEGRIDILINNASYALIGPVEHLPMEQFRDQMEVNFLAPVRICQAVLPHMRAQNQGRILNMSSINAAFGVSGGSAYCASKSALEAFSEALYFEALPWNILVSIIEPGYVVTNFVLEVGNKFLENSPYEALLEMCEKESLMRINAPETAVGCIPTQSTEEIASILYTIIQEEKPHLRYQTSEAATEHVSLTRRDLSGDLLSQSEK